VQELSLRGMPMPKQSLKKGAEIREQKREANPKHEILNTKQCRKLKIKLQKSK